MSEKPLRESERIGRKYFARHPYAIAVASAIDDAIRNSNADMVKTLKGIQEFRY